MTMTNNEIYNIASALNKSFADATQKLPVKINFYIQKNKNVLIALAQDIEQTRVDILKEYGTLNSETNQFEFTPDKAQIVMKELNDLFALEQDVNIYTISIDSFSDDLTLTTGQMEALMFMID